MNNAITRRAMIAGTAAVGTAVAAGASVANAEPSLKGKSILITGTSSGFGHLGALHLARGGARVIATMRNLPRPEADKLRAA
ncbi:MAG: short-chain dehydrogenase/reductase, partial [Sphingomonadaceae bacterium]